jgi:16S rRNA (guanine966-N2)-methyltransferase
VREALFSILGEVAPARVLDLYAGTGALGIEALSRGALHATFVEVRAEALATLRRNLSRLELAELATVLPVRVERAARSLRAHAPYDLVFIDPPWRDLPAAAEHAFRLLGGDLLSPGARVILEHPSRGRLTLPASFGFLEVDRRTWGDTQVSFFAPENLANPRA